MGILALASLLVAGTGVFLISRILPNLSPTQRRLQRDIKLLREQLAEQDFELIPLEGGEIELLSDNQLDSKKARGFKKISRGTFTTIYNEPVLSYAFRKYLSGPDGLIVAKTRKHEFIFWIRAKGSRLIIDETFTGVLDPEGRLLDRPKGKETLATLQKQENGMKVFRVGEREVATFSALRPPDKSGLQYRVFELVSSPLEEEERKLLLAITLYELITRMPD